MVVVINHPGTPTKRVDLGPGHGERHPWNLMRKTVDDAPKRPPR